MRQRINRNAICSSDNYKASRRVHQDFLKEKHDHFCGLMISGELSIDVPNADGSGRFTPKFKTIRIFGTEMRVTIEEYNTHYKKCNF